MASAIPAADLFDKAVPDAEHTLGGLKEDTEPEHPSVVMAIGVFPWRPVFRNEAECNPVPLL